METELIGRYGLLGVAILALAALWKSQRADIATLVSRFDAMLLQQRADHKEALKDERASHLDEIKIVREIKRECGNYAQRSQPNDATGN